MVDVSPRRRRRGILIGFSAFAILLGALAGGGYWYIRSQLNSSLPRLSGTFSIPGIHAPVRITRDAHGVPTIHAASWPDLAFGLGVAHGQDRFFQMDLLRRSAAGELADLVGPAALDMDKRARVHRFRQRMRAEWEQFSPHDRAAIEAYALGVNWGLKQGLSAPGAKPFEYLLLGADPQPWTGEDCLLAVCAMYQALQLHQVQTEKLRADLAAAFPSPVAAFLDPDGTAWDAPLDGSQLPLPIIPPASVLNIRRDVRMALERGEAEETQRPVLGSNNWAVDGKHSRHGGALLADDMHLQLQLPNIWYRAALVWTDPDGQSRRACGVTLPGGPALVAGSNGYLAWGFTNTEGDWLDLLRIQTHPENPRQYRSREGWKEFTSRREVIHVKGQPDQMLEVRETDWGPITDKDKQGRPYALRWIAHQAGAVNLQLARMLSVRTLEDALELAPQCGIPHQNFVCADRSGRIAWSIIGKIPRRQGRLQRGAAPALEQCQWNGFLSASDYPRLVNPTSGRIWTANNRVMGGEAWQMIGNGGVDSGLRAGQIRDRLMAKETHAEKDLLAIQLDDEARSFRKWQQLFLQMVPPQQPGFPRREALVRIVAAWGGFADADSVGYRILEQFRREVRTNIYEPFRDIAQKKGIFAGPGWGAGFQQQEEGPLWVLASTRPDHLLSPRFESWQSLFLDAADRTARVLQASGLPLEEATWGRANSTWVRHPLGLAVPLLGRWLDVPPTPLPGARFDLPRVTSIGHGASERFVVSPGKEEQGIFHMPGGQSGHPLSPYYRDGHTAWEKGEPTPFLPGEPLHELILTPSQR